MDRNLYQECLGEQLRHIRATRGIRQVHLAELTNLSRLTVRGLEKGKGNLSSFYAVLGALGLEVDVSRCPAGAHIGDRVAKLRRKKNISQRALAAAISVSHPTVVKLKNMPKADCLP